MSMTLTAVSSPSVGSHKTAFSRRLGQNILLSSICRCPGVEKLPPTPHNQGWIPQLQSISVSARSEPRKFISSQNGRKQDFPHYIKAQEVIAICRNHRHMGICTAIIIYHFLFCTIFSNMRNVFIFFFLSRSTTGYKEHVFLRSFFSFRDMNSDK